MNVLIVVALTLVALAGLAVVATNVPERQAVTLSFLGLTEVVLFLALQAPDVALSQLGIGAAIVPLMVMLAIRTMNARHSGGQKAADPGGEDESRDEALPGQDGDGM
jgi:energy-converting hydrogenase B subunit D